MFLDTGVNSNTPADYKLQAAEHPYATDGNLAFKFSKFKLYYSWVGSNWSVCRHLCLSLDPIEW